MNTTAQTWSLPPHTVTVQPGQVHIWRFSLNVDPALLASLEAVLDSEERRKLDRLNQPTVRRHYVVSHGIVRWILARYLGISPQALRFECGPHGKPALRCSENPTGLQFNLSHSHETALFAVTQGCPVGIDLEYVRQDIEALPLAERFFTPREATAIRALDAQQRIAAFFHAWTQKEALVKAQGKAIVSQLGKVEVPIDYNALKPDTSWVFRIKDGLWTVSGLPELAGYSAAVVVQGQKREGRYWFWTESS